MTTARARPLRLHVAAADLDVAALLLEPAGAAAMFVMAHGAGADMHHAFMDGMARGFAAHGVATLRARAPARALTVPG